MEHFRDADDPDENGEYSYYYEGNWFTFEEGDETVAATVYVDEADVAYLRPLTCEQAQRSPLARAAAAHLRDRGVTTFKCYDEETGYQYCPDLD
ncbi:hypothetical protein CGZ93_05970 [Enemella dayhoffiae]|uniref:Uncharacterized protein n=1 Tax=Enemella dayhoffiae TaxID=2016507 RepID=A0A255H768_9ACTN|nr:hypothetical protein CGZ93_05970 [Enemella dayhoffiae]